MIRAIVLAAGESRRMGMPKPLLRFVRSMGVSPMRTRDIHGQDARATKSCDTTFLEQIVGVLRQSDVDGITVVLGSQAETIRASTDLSGVDVVINENYRAGQLSSLIAGLRQSGEGIGPPNAKDRVWEPGPPLRPAGLTWRDRPGLASRGRLALGSEKEEQGQDALATAEAILLCLVDNPFITTDVVNRVVRGFRETHKPIIVPVFNGRRGHPTLFARAVFDELLNAPANEGARYVVNADKGRVLEIEVSDRAILMRIDTPEEYVAHFGTAPRICEGR